MSRRPTPATTAEPVRAVVGETDQLRRVEGAYKAPPPQLVHLAGEDMKGGGTAPPQSDARYGGVARKSGPPASRQMPLAHIDPAGSIRTTPSVTSWRGCRPGEQGFDGLDAEPPIRTTGRHYLGRQSCGSFRRGTGTTERAPRARSVASHG